MIRIPCSLLYMGDFNGPEMDSMRGGIHRILVDEQKNEKIIPTRCPHSFTIDYMSRDIFWNDGCTYQTKTCKLDGSSSRLLDIGHSFFSYGTSVFKSRLCWISNNERSVFCSDVVNVDVKKIHTQGTIMRDMQLVHPLNQPSGKLLWVWLC